MGRKRIIELKDYLVVKPKKDRIDESDKHKKVRCIIYINEELFNFLGVVELKDIYGKATSNSTNKCRSLLTGTKHGKTIQIITDGEGKELYKNSYQITVPESYPVAFVRQWLHEINNNINAPCHKKLRYVKIKNGWRYFI